jgi:hypothetical protein
LYLYPKQTEKIVDIYICMCYTVIMKERYKHENICK